MTKQQDEYATIVSSSHALFVSGNKCIATPATLHPQFWISQAPLWQGSMEKGTKERPCIAAELRLSKIPYGDSHVAALKLSEQTKGGSE